MLISDPSWENHRALFSNAGFLVETYTYYDAGKRGVNFDGMLASLKAAVPGTIVVVACLLPIQLAMTLPWRSGTKWWKRSGQAG